MTNQILKRQQRQIPKEVAGMTDNDILAYNLLTKWLLAQKQEKMAAFVDKLAVSWIECASIARELLREREEARRR